MKIDITSAISELLYEHRTVVLPGLGAFVTAYKAASIDYVQGQVAPPTKELDFNPNLPVNDGILVNRIQKKYSVTAGQAEEAINKYVNEIKATLDKKEMVVFPKVGKLYKDFEGNFKFLTENENYNTDSFGLPEINFFPILREKKSRKPAAGAAAATAYKRSQPQKRDRNLPAWMNVLLPILAVLSVVVLAFSIYMLQSNDMPAKSEELTLNSERTNTKPSNELDDPEDREDFLADEDSENTDEDTEAPTPPPNLKEAFIIIHSFGNQSNVEKFVKTLISDGFQPKSVKDGNLTRVGILKAYEEDSELEETLAELKKLYETTPKIWDK